MAAAEWTMGVKKFDSRRLNNFTPGGKEFLP